MYLRYLTFNPLIRHIFEKKYNQQYRLKIAPSLVLKRCELIEYKLY